LNLKIERESNNNYGCGEEATTPMARIRAPASAVLSHISF